MSVLLSPVLRHARASLRVGSYLGVVFLLLAVLAVRSARGSISEQVLLAGRQLSKLEDLTASSSHVVLNGEPMNVASATTTASVRAVLDRVEGICKEDGAVAHDLRDLGGVLADAGLARAARGFNLGVLRRETDSEGVVACAVKDPSHPGRSFWDGLAAFGKSLDLADVGLLRYVYARKTPSGRTHVISAWTDGSFRFQSMLAPADGRDAPGSDPVAALRPPRSVRFLTAAVDGGPGSVRVYESEERAQAVLAAYDRAMPSMGWKRLLVQEEVPEARYYTRRGVDLLVGRLR